MSNRKKQIREDFKAEVFSRDNFKCRKCNNPAVDAHHIIDRNELPNNGYVKENGISLCEKCHKLAEVYHSTNKTKWVQGFHPNELFFLIYSSIWKAKLADLKFRL